ncbi:MAG: NHL repeat-containing protein [Acidobacteriia bacterium]|nr:NHL repeat-containing protein [Terriglobia bacterium]
MKGPFPRTLRFFRFSTSLLLFVVCLAGFAWGCGRSAPPTTAAAAPQPVLEYLGFWGTRGNGPGQLAAPVALAVDASANALVADAGSGFVNKFSLAGEPRLSFQDDRLDLHPTSLAVDDGGAIYVAEGRRGSVLIYYPDGKRYREMRVAPAKAFRGTLRVAVNDDGNLYVAGKRPFGVRLYTRRGRLVRAWARGAVREAALEEPAGLAVGPDGLIYVSEAAQALVRVYRADGTLLRTLTAPGEGAQFAGIAVNGGLVLAADPRNHALHVWSRDGSYRLRADLSPWIAGSQASPVAVAMTPAGECLVLDTPGARVLRFRLHL